MLSRYAGVGTICPSFNVSTASGGSLTSSGSLYFSFQLQNRAGFNAPVVSSQISYTAGQKIQITIPDTVRKSGWDIHYFVISAGTTNDPSTHVALARYPGFQFGDGIDPQTLLSELPATIELTRMQHIVLAPTVANLAALPTGIDRKDGQVRWVASESKWFEYRADSSQIESANVIAVNVGQWVRVASPSTYVENSTDAGGSDRALPSIEPTSIVPTPDYPGNTLEKELSTWESKYFIYNDTDINLPEGIEFGIELEYNNLRSPDLLSGLFMIEFKGFVQNDGTLRTAKISDDSEFSNIGGYVPWTPKLTTNFLLPDDLLPTEAILIAVKPFFSSAELDFYSDYRSGSTGMNSGDIIGIKPVIRTQSGDYNPLGKLLNDGSVVLNLGDQYRVVPDIGLSYKVLSGCALVKSYDFPTKPTRTFSGLVANTADQKIVINGNGSVFTELDSYILQSSEALRAITSTLSGESHAGTFSTYIANSSSSGFDITLNYPCTAAGLGTIRSDYPDVIAGNAKGSFNPYGVNIYLQRQDTLEIRKFTGNLVVAGESQTFTISDWTSGAIASLPSAEFGLFTPGTSSLVSSDSGSFPVTNYRVSYSFVYDGNQITDIDHSSPPCIYEWVGDLQPPSVTVVSTTTIAHGENAEVVNVGTGNAAELEFYLPPGEVLSVIDIAALTAIAPAYRSNGLVVAVQDSGDTTPKIYIFDADAATGGVAPDTGTGRWVAASSSGGTGADITRTSTTSNSIGTGSKTFNFTTSANLGWLVGTRLRAANSGSNYIEGEITAVDDSSVTISSDKSIGSGTFTSWNIALTGDSGTDGDSSYTYIAYADDSSGTGFTNTFNTSKDWIAIKTTTSLIASPIASDFTGLWKNYKGATGTTGSVSSASDLTLIEVGSTPTTSTNEAKLYNLNNVPTIRLESNGTQLVIAGTNVVQGYTATQFGSPSVQNISGSVTLDGSTANVFILTLTGNVSNLTMNNVQVGATYIIYLIEDTTGSRTVSLDSIFKRLVGDTTTVNTVANKVNLLTGIARSTSVITLAPISTEV
jgi:hypothetical protein